MPRITPPKPTSTTSIEYPAHCTHCGVFLESKKVGICKACYEIRLSQDKDTSAPCFYYITPTLTVQRQPLSHTKYIKLAEDLKKVHNHFTSPEQANQALAEIRKLYRNPHLIEDCHQSIAKAEHKLEEARIAYTKIKNIVTDQYANDNEWIRRYKQLEKSLPSLNQRFFWRLCVVYTTISIIFIICLALFLYVQ